MIVVQNLVTNERYNYQTQTISLDSSKIDPIIPDGYILSPDQTLADQYLTTLVEPEMGQYVDSLRWPAEPANPLNQGKWTD